MGTEQHDDGNQGQPPAATQEQGTGGSLLEDQAAHEQSTNASGQTGGQGDGSSGEGGSTNGDPAQAQGLAGVSVDDLVSALEGRLADRFDAVADRRVNALLKEIRKGQPEGQQPPPPEGQQQTPPPAPSGGPGLDRSLVRGSRVAYREFMDGFTYVAAEEREFAADYATALIQQQVLDGADDEDKIGREVAKQVKDRLGALRKTYEEKTVAALKRQGRLTDAPGQPTPGPGAPGGKPSKIGSQSFADGAAKAAAMFGKQDQN